MAFLMRQKVDIQSLLLLMLLLAVCQSRFFSHKYTIHDFKREKGWLYLGKHTFQPANTRISLGVILGNNQIKVDSFLDLQVLAVPAQFWQNEVKYQCNVSRYDFEMFQTKTQKQVSFKMMISNQSRVYQTTKQVQSKEAKTYYFVLKDCLDTFQKENPSPYSQLKLDLEVKSNQRHFVSNEQHNNWTLPLFIALYYILLRFINRNKDSSGNTWPRILVKISIWLSLFSLVFRFADHLYYAYSSGSHSNFLDALSLICQSTYDSLIIFVFTLLAFGWTIKFDTHQGFTTWMPVCLISYFLLIVIMIMNKSRDLYHTKYHVFDTFAGYIMIVIRVGLYSLFLFQIQKAYKQLTQKDTKLRSFLFQLTLFVTAFMSYFPLCFVLIQLFEKESRYQVMNTMLQVMQLLLGIWFSVLICWVGSIYRKVVGTIVVESKHEKYF